MANYTEGEIVSKVRELSNDSLREIAVLVLQLEASVEGLADLVERRETRIRELEGNG